MYSIRISNEYKFLKLFPEFPIEPIYIQVDVY